MHDDFETKAPTNSRLVGAHNNQNHIELERQIVSHNQTPRKIPCIFPRACGFAMNRKPMAGSSSAFKRSPRSSATCDLLRASWSSFGVSKSTCKPTPGETGEPKLVIDLTME